MSSVTVSRGIVKATSPYSRIARGNIIVNANGSSVSLTDEQARELLAQLCSAVGVVVPSPAASILH